VMPQVVRASLFLISIVLMPNHETHPQIWVVGFKRQIDYEFVVISLKPKTSMGMGVPIKLINSSLKNFVSISQFSKHMRNNALAQFIIFLKHLNRFALICAFLLVEV